MRWLYVFLSISAAILGASANAETLQEAWYVHRMEMKVQERGSDCAPISLFNSLLIGPRDLSSAVSSLGKNTDRRYQSLLDLYGTKPSRFDSNVPRFDPERGIDMRNLADMANDLIAGKNGRFETSFVSVKRNTLTIAQDLASSLRQHFGPILSMEFHSADGKTDATSHAVVLLTINQWDPTQRRMNVTVLEPETFDLLTFDLTEYNGALVSSEKKLGPFDVSNGLITLDSYLVFNR